MRNFGHSGMFEQIESEASLLLISVLCDPRTSESAAIGAVYPLNDRHERWIVRFQRDILDMAHGRWLWSRAAERRWKVRDKEAKSIRQRVKRIARKIISQPFANKKGLAILSKSERLSSRYFNPSNEYRDLYREVRPSLVFNGSHIHSKNAIQAVQAAQWLGIPTATFIFSWDNLTSQGRITLPYDYFLVWNEELKEQLLKMYDWIKPSNVFVTGTPQFDFHFRQEFYQTREEFCQSIGADPKRPIVFYATGMPNHMPCEPEIVEEIADMLNQPGFEGRPQLLVRVYPKDRTGRFNELKNRRPEILFPDVAWEEAWLTPKFEDSFALVNTLRHCALGINVASTVSLELCMFEKPVVNVGYNPPSVTQDTLSYADYYSFDHYKPVVESGAIRVAESPEQMCTLIREALHSPTSQAGKQRQLINQMFGATLDGNSARRVADVLLHLAGVTDTKE